jgi:hypothetical protein
MEIRRNLCVRAHYYDHLPPTALTRSTVLLTFALADGTFHDLAAL